MRLAILVGAMVALAGCRSNPYCLTCANNGLTGVDLGSAPDLYGNGPRDLSGGPPDLTGPCSPTNGGVEICDGLDNDCNGTVDDVPAAALANDPNNCGACGNVCNFQSNHQFGGCMSQNGTPTCVTTSCMPGFVDLDGKPDNGCEYACVPTIPPTEVCDGRDNDCDGQVDNGAVAPSGLCSNKGVCSSVTVPVVCHGAAGWKCDYSAVPNVEIDGSGRLTVIETKCDSLDNNCNGVADKDGFPTLTQTCQAGQGVCQNTGTIVCKTINTAGCSVTASPERATDEACNDLDDNCDGNRDERTPTVATLCPDGVGGMRACKGFIDPMVAIGGGVFIYEYEASRPDATNTSPGGVSRRACSKANALPWGSVTWQQAVDACAAVKDSTGAGLRLCTAAEWQKACEGVAGPPAAGNKKWSVTPAPSPTPAPQVCNDVRGPGAPWATATTGTTGTSQRCYATWNGNDRVYDLSGNLAEWTSTVVVNSPIYYGVRGGSYSSPADGTACEFDFDIFQPTFFDSSLGFRCCADHAP